MEHTDEFAKYKALGLKNKKTLEQLSEHIFNNRDIFNIQNLNHKKMRQQYDIMLTASKDSIQYNTQLQIELEEKQEHLKTLKLKLHKQNRQLENLSNEVTKATGNLKRQKHNHHQLMKSQQDVEKMRRDIDRLRRKKEELVKQQKQIESKENDLKLSMIKLDEQLRQMELKHEHQESNIQKEIVQLQESIRREKNELNSIRQMNSSRLKTPDKNSEKRQSFAEIQMLIRQQKQKEIN